MKSQKWRTEAPCVVFLVSTLGERWQQAGSSLVVGAPTEGSPSVIEEQLDRDKSCGEGTQSFSSWSQLKTVSFEYRTGGKKLV